MRSISRVVFFGTPEFSLATLEALWASPYRPILVVTQPARRSGRGRRLEEPPVSRWAEAKGIGVLQPEKVRDPSFLQEFEELLPDLAVVVAFGQIFPPRLLEIPRFGCVNLHASLLPMYRGAAPIQAAIVAGDKETGVTTMQMDEGMDTGPILRQRRCPIGDEERSPELAERLASMGGELMVETIRGLDEGSITPREQDPGAATMAPRLRKEDGFVDWRLDAGDLYRRFRAFQPWPGLTTSCSGKPLKLIEVGVLKGAKARSAPPGSYLGVQNEALAVACGEGSVLGLRLVQRPGRRVVSGIELQRSEDLTPGDLEFSGSHAET